KIPFWSHANGMKDIIWYTPTLQADGSYTVTAKASDHENADGKYEAQVFYVDAQGQNKFVKKAFIDYKNQSRPTGTLLIQNNNKDTGTFDVIIKDVYSPKGVQTVQVPTWSDKDGQDDIRWYEATRQANGDYKVSVKASDHKNSTGKYHVHLYYIQNDGSRIGIGTTTTDVEVRNAMTKTQASIKNVNATNGTYTVAVDQAPQGRQIKNIRVAAWSKAHQENLYWYSATPTGMHTEITVSTNNHGNEAGSYTTHVYVDYKDGGVEGFNLGQTALSPRNQKVNPQTTYYSQRDPRWAGKYYGVSNVDQSGCVPTSLAMTFTDILGRTILPTTVADYLYNNTDSFNKGEAGTDSDGIVAATRNWGLKSQLINGAGGIAEALMAGKHVLAAVGNSQFTSDPYTHELVLHGYDNGRTYVRDPYNSGNNGWYSINYLHSIKSKDPMDNKLGAPFFSIFA
ncbi:GBS Bsp-like repeat-containing protein, partial [Streptococcus parasanguinis]